MGTKITKIWELKFKKSRNKILKKGHKSYKIREQKVTKI
jgi:hypothetical protein